MKLSKAQLDLINILKILKIDTETIIGIMLATNQYNKTEDLLMKIIEMKNNNQEITKQKILQEITNY